MNTLSSIGSLPLSLTANSPLARAEGARMAAPIKPSEIPLPGTVAPGSAVTGTSRSSEGSFSNMLGKLVTEVNAKQQAAGQAVAGLQAGEPVTLHQAMIAMEEASVSFQLMAEVRNRLLDSYQELMRMQV